MIETRFNGFSCRKLVQKTVETVETSRNYFASRSLLHMFQKRANFTSQSPRSPCSDQTMTQQVSDSEFEWQANVVKNVVHEAAAALTSRLPHIKPLIIAQDGLSYHVSCQSGAGVPALRNRLIDIAQDLPFYGELLPVSWLHARDGMHTN